MNKTTFNLVDGEMQLGTFFKLHQRSARIAIFMMLIFGKDAKFHSYLMNQCVRELLQFRDNYASTDVVYLVASWPCWNEIARRSTGKFFLVTFMQNVNAERSENMHPYFLQILLRQRFQINFFLNKMPGADFD